MPETVRLWRHPIGTRNYLTLIIAVSLSSSAAGGASPNCSSSTLGQAASLKGTWERHEDPQFRGLYNPAVSCPAWAKDWDCSTDAEINHENIANAYNKVFKPYECVLRPWSAQEFAQCTEQRRIIMIGDSVMRQQWLSLACLLNEVTVAGEHHFWDQERIPVAMNMNYTARGVTGDFIIPRQYLGQFQLTTGAQIYLRAFGRFNLTLWDDVFAEFLPLRQTDVIIVNFGAWYPRYNVHESGDPWKDWQVDMAELIDLRLSRYPARSLFRSSTATHFGGINGTMTFDKEACKRLALAGHCPASPLNEHWYEDFIKMFLRSCGSRCANVQLLPVFELTQARNDAHHGSFGRGRESWVLDCRHFCTSVVDVINQVLMSMLC